MLVMQDILRNVLFFGYQGDMEYKSTYMYLYHTSYNLLQDIEEFGEIEPLKSVLSNYPFMAQGQTIPS